MQHISVGNFWTMGSDTRGLAPASVRSQFQVCHTGTFMESFAITRGMHLSDKCQHTLQF